VLFIRAWWAADFGSRRSGWRGAVVRRRRGGSWGLCQRRAFRFGAPRGPERDAGAPRGPERDAGVSVSGVGRASMQGPGRINARWSLRADPLGTRLAPTQVAKTRPNGTEPNRGP